MTFRNSKLKSLQTVHKGEKLWKQNSFGSDITLKPKAKLMDYPRNKLKAEYDPPTAEASMLQKSIKFIPLSNNEPKPTDSPYLFKIKRLRDLPYTKSHSHKRDHLNKTECIPRPPPKPLLVTPEEDHTESAPIQLNLRCPKNPTSLLKRTHQNFVISYVDFLNNLQNSMNDDETTPIVARDAEGRELSISCAMCCSLPPRPREVEKKTTDPNLGKYVPPADYNGPVAYFPDFPSLFEDGKVPLGAIPGWMDADGVFHPAQMGDALPSDAVIGYWKDGVFHPLMTVKEGVRRGIVGVRMANSNVIGEYADGDSRFAFSRIRGYQDSNRRVHPITPQDKLGYVDGSADFHELPLGVSFPTDGAPAALINERIIYLGHSTPLAEEIPIGSLAGYVDANHMFHELKAEDEIVQGGIAAYENEDQEVILLTDRRMDWWNRVPEETVGGFLDAFGNFNPLKKGEKVLPGGTPAYQLADGKVIPISMSDEGYEDSTGKFHYFTPDTKFGYIDENYDFHELAPGETIPPGGISAFMDADGAIVPMSQSRSYPNDLSKLGYTGEDEDLTEDERNLLADLETDMWSELPEGAVRGYLDDDGNFHFLKEGDEIPTGGRPAYQTTDGKVVPIRTSISGKDLWNTVPDGANYGYLDEAGNFHQLNKGDKIPIGGRPAYQTSDGNIVPIRTSATGKDLWNEVPDGAQRGYLDEAGNFHALNEGDKIPIGGRPAYQTKDGNIIPIRTSATGKDLWNKVPDGAQRGYLDEAGNFHALNEGDKIPIGGRPAYQTTDGKVVPIRTSATGQDWWNQVPEGTKGGYLDESGNFHPLHSGDKIPTGGRPAYQTADGTVVPIRTSISGIELWNQSPEGAILGYTDESGNFHALKKGGNIPPGGRPAYQAIDGTIVRASPPITAYQDSAGNIHNITPLTKFGYTDKNGNFYPLAIGEARPADGMPAIMEPDGRIIGMSNARSSKDFIPHGAVSGFVDAKHTFHELKDTEEVPPGGIRAYKKESKEIILLTDPKTDWWNHLPKNVIGGFLDAVGNFHALKRGDKLPPGGSPAYQTADGNVTPIRIIPAGSVTGWIDENGVFHGLSDGEEIPPWGIPAYKMLDGVVVEDLSDVFGWMDKDTLKFHTRKSEIALKNGSFLIYQPIDETIPEGGRAAYRHANGEVELLPPGQKPPLGTMPGWVDEEGIFHHFTTKKRAGEDVDPRTGFALTDEELERFENFKRHFGIQCELEVVRGSLDLGEVSRQSFRIYSHGGSVDIDEIKLPYEPEQQK